MGGIQKHNSAARGMPAATNTEHRSIENGQFAVLNVSNMPSKTSSKIFVDDILMKKIFFMKGLPIKFMLAVVESRV